MKTTEVKTYFANIYVGLRVGYRNEINSIDKVNNICQDYCNKISYCVTITPTKFVYKNGEEPGAIIGLINYPRFPSEEDQILKKALDLAEILQKELKQYRVSIVTPDKTIMLEDEEIN